MGNKGLIIIMDGLGDLEYDELDGFTPLDSAKTPNMDNLSNIGETGYHIPIESGIIPGSDTSHLAIFGYNPHQFYQGRGVYEALGANFDLKHGDIAFRSNLGYVKDGIIVDRRSGREPFLMDKIYNLFNDIDIGGVKIFSQHTTEHRGIIVLRGDNLSRRITDVDPHKVNVAYNKCEPEVKTDSAIKTAKVVNLLTEKAHKLLKDSKFNDLRVKKGLMPANFFLIRGAGNYTPINPVTNRFNVRMACIAGGALYKGVSKFIGMDVYDVPGATGDAKTDLDSKLDYCVKASQDHDIVFLHIKATDSYGHDGDFVGKKEFIEKVDRKIFSKISNHFDTILVTGDHSTPCKRKGHSGDKVPLFIWGNNTRNDFGTFSEVNKHPSLFLRSKDIMPNLLNKLELSEKYGE
ncbi:MAG: 2,3-bisphosphoglycerate-independent phosphoglycerate mutase [Candidatus Woesearchaeota archaeon]